MNYDLTAVPATGSVQFELMTNEHVFKQGLVAEKNPKSPKYLSIQLMNQIPVMVGCSPPPGVLPALQNVSMPCRLDCSTTPLRLCWQCRPTPLQMQVDVPTKPCDRIAGDRRYCEYSNPDQLMLNFKGWNDKTQFTQVGQQGSRSWPGPPGKCSLSQHLSDAQHACSLELQCLC
jgi:hypothetical protein